MTVQARLGSLSSVTRHVSALKTELAQLGALAEVGLSKDLSLADRIRALAAELEALSPMEEPARAAALLKGRWRLLYANFDFERRTSLARISLGVLPDVTVELVDFYNEIDPATGLYDNVIHLIDGEGVPQKLVMAGRYAVEDDHTIDIETVSVTITGGNGRLTLPGDGAKFRNLRTHILYLDDGFRLVRGMLGALYVLERLDPAPLHWAREG